MQGQRRRGPSLGGFSPVVTTLETNIVEHLLGNNSQGPVKDLLMASPFIDVAAGVQRGGSLLTIPVSKKEN